jgi:branched-chain amino acid transport system permease protein
MLTNAIIYGFVNSVILMLVALGFNVTFGISGVANFAYGALYILGALSCWVFLNPIGLPYFLAVILAVAVSWSSLNIWVLSALNILCRS